MNCPRKTAIPVSGGGGGRNKSGWGLQLIYYNLHIFSFRSYRKNWKETSTLRYDCFPSKLNVDIFFVIKKCSIIIMPCYFNFDNKPLGIHTNYLHLYARSIIIMLRC